jgi:catechol 2,3-dioxygenase-like lactoylglutathione lyase family enzyme
MGEGVIQGLGYLVVEVTDLASAELFYADGLGFIPEGRDLWPEGGASILMKAGDQHLFLVQNPDSTPPTEGGTHQAYRCAPAAREAIGGRLVGAGFTVETYAENRPAEAGDNFYAVDPSGNRVQLVARADGHANPDGVAGIDHACVEDYDMQWAEEFYSQTLGLPVDYWHGLRTEDYTDAQDWEAGTRDMAPGCNRMVRYYRAIPGQNRMQARPTLQVYMRAGDDIVGVYMTMADYAEPPEEQLRGGRCLAFSVAPGGLDQVVRALESAGRKFIGPIAGGDEAPLGATIYSRDTGGNFLAFTETE